MKLPVRVRNMGGYENILRQQIENIPTTLSAYVYIYIYIYIYKYTKVEPELIASEPLSFIIGEYEKMAKRDQ